MDESYCSINEEFLDCTKDKFYDMYRKLFKRYFQRKRMYDERFLLTEYFCTFDKLI